jgi:hypothetical protein
MARIAKFDKPKIFSYETVGNDGFAITYVQKIYFKLVEPIPEGATYINKDTITKEKMIPVNTKEFFEAEKLLKEGKLIGIIPLPCEEQLR